MSQISDAIAAAQAVQGALDTSVDAMEARVTADIAAPQQLIVALQTQIAALQAQIDAGNNDPALVQAVNDLTAKMTATQARVDNIDPAKATPPAPGPDTTPATGPDTGPAPAPAPGPDTTPAPPAPTP